MHCKMQHLFLLSTFFFQIKVVSDCSYWTDSTSHQLPHQTVQISSTWHQLSLISSDLFNMTSTVTDQFRSLQHDINCHWSVQISSTWHQLSLISSDLFNMTSTVTDRFTYLQGHINCYWSVQIISSTSHQLSLISSDIFNIRSTVTLISSNIFEKIM